MNLKQVRVCPSCGKVSPVSLDFECPVCNGPLDSVNPIFIDEDIPPVTDETRPHDAPADTAAAPNADQSICPHGDCAQPNPLGSVDCIYCNRPMQLSSAVLLTWPWGRSELLGCLQIGRDPPAPGELAARIEADFPNVSRHHALLEVDADGIWITDLNSTNGTFLNDVRLEPGRRTKLSSAEENIRFAASLTLVVNKR